ncbi:MAG: hypothetical protein HY774_15775 [Acidobacteria bacterium]|nr:hypothetical protein [Candidatus Woesearchaeota archaeon]MBI4749945.1 hypothetical protein [Acidobacteriota bacterium]
MVHFLLSQRAEVMLSAKPDAWKPPGLTEVSIALQQIECPPVDSFIVFLTTYGGLQYNPYIQHGKRFYQVQFSPLPGRFPLDLREVVSKVNNDWVLDLGVHHRLGQFGFCLDTSGRVLWEYEIPIFSSIEHLIESDALENMLGQVEGRWIWVSGITHSDPSTILDTLIDLQKVTEASGQWNTWWIGDGLFVRYFLSWEWGDRPRVLWIYAQSSSNLNRLLMQLRPIFKKPPVLRSWPFVASETDQSAW